MHGGETSYNQHEIQDGSQNDVTESYETLKMIKNKEFPTHRLSFSNFDQSLFAVNTADLSNINFSQFDVQFGGSVPRHTSSSIPRQGRPYTQPIQYPPLTNMVRHPAQQPGRRQPTPVMESSRRQAVERKGVDTGAYSFTILL